MMRNLFAAILAVFFVFAFQPAAHATEKFIVLLDWFVNPDHGPLFVALENGYFRDAGLAVEFIAPADPNDPPKLVAAGKGDVAISYQPQLHLQIAGGLPLVRIGTLVSSPLNSLVVLASSPVHNIADLKGRKIGYSIGGFEQAVLGTMLESAGLKLTDVELINVNWSLSPSLMAGKVDAVIGAFRNFELNQMDIEGHPGRAFLVEEHGVPAYDELIMVAHKDRTGDARLARFVAAVGRGAQFLAEHPQAAWKLFVKGRENELDTELNRRAWRDTSQYFARKPGKLDRGRYERFAAFLNRKGLIATPPPVESYAIELQ